MTSGNYTIVLNGSETASGRQAGFARHGVDGFSLTVKGKGIVTIETSGLGVGRGKDVAKGSLFSVSKSYTLILDGPELKLHGSLENDHPLIQVSGGTFILKAGTIEDNGVGGVWVGDYGSFIMEGGTISDNKVSLIGGGGVSVDKNGIFTMKDGLIEKNTKGGGGGGVYVRYGKFDMNGGTISKNRTNTWGGGVIVGTTNAIDPVSLN